MAGVAIKPSSDYSDISERDLTTALQIETELDPLPDDDMTSSQIAIALEQRKDLFLLQLIIWLTQNQTAEQVQNTSLVPELKAFDQQLDSFLLEGCILMHV